MNLHKLDEKVKEIEELWSKKVISPEEVKKATEGYELHKQYDYGTFREVSVLVYKKGEKRLFVVRNNATLAFKLITDEWSEAESLARQLADRYKALNSLFGF